MTQTDDEIKEQLDLSMENEGKSKWPGMTYEQGVEAALRWVLDGDTPPMAD